ncbi:oligopeptide transport system ATP-binding protein [Paenibacillus algorifonticola]|uniref:Oligopeptide transport system ATP-binding protein n=1 Tax=Paenibacillus algorifonticola TaxID=684063 RepID=A0A1I2GPU7_9BACL|nr:oligopeptide/dipeptide ABC transporter ATP-binding protein [Paenibacillus algorifonticola]SFF18867.1 oligopeptide transport system ATP-binding protein [Paenibacillus algorifonticola]
MPSIHEQEGGPMPLLEVKGLSKHYSTKRPASFRKSLVKAVDDVSFHIYEGETYGLVGESGCGKSTLGKTLLRLVEPTAGEALYQGEDLNRMPSRQLRASRRQLQMVFQDPYSSLNPRKTIGRTLEEPLIIHGIGSPQERTELAMRMLETVGLQEEHYDRLPHELSGGQRQRIGLARALILEPRLVICDEPVSALDVIIQSQIINLMRKLQRELKLTYLFIAHDIGVIRHISDRIGVMYLGKMVEEARTDDLFAQPLHPYTQVLLSAVPIPDPRVKKERMILQGDIPSPLETVSGCAFHPRCPFAVETCRKLAPAKREVAPGHFAACHLA